MDIKENEIKFAKVRPTAIIPTKSDENAGYDVYACFDEDYLRIKPHETKLIPTGIASALDNSKYIQIEERGSTGSKGIKKSAGVIDSSYRGEWFIAITNTNDVPIVIAKDGVYADKVFPEWLILRGEYIWYPYSKAIAQAIVHEVPKMEVNEISYDELVTIKSERGIGALGSSLK